jgi:hypothetical protein
VNPHLSDDGTARSWYTEGEMNETGCGWWQKAAPTWC